MKIFVYLDESGSIHKNSKTRYFAVGGYFAFMDDKNKITSLYKRINKSIKDNRKIELNKEINHMIWLMMTKLIYLKTFKI